MVNRVTQAKRNKMRRAYLKRPIRVSSGPSRAAIAPDQQGYFEYRHRGASLAVDEDWLHWFFKTPDLTEGHKTMSAERAQSLKTMAQYRSLEQTERRQWYTVWNSNVLVPGSRNWTKIYFDRNRYIFVQRVRNVLRASITYAADRWRNAFDNNKIQWRVLLEFSDPPD